jgi:hypothetical protein
MKKSQSREKWGWRSRFKGKKLLVKPWAEGVYELAANLKCGFFYFNCAFGFRKNSPKAERPVIRERLKALI